MRQPHSEDRAAAQARGKRLPEGPVGTAGIAPASLHVQVVHRALVARNVVALWLAQPGTTRAPAPYRPGQFITLTLPTEREPLVRSYSLCGDGRLERPWQITIKRQYAGAVSNFLYERAEPGALLYASPPRGAFTLPAQLPPRIPLVFIAGGSGIAPIYGMLRALARLPEQQRPRAQLHYASSSPDDIIYERELAALDPDTRWLAIHHYIASDGEQLTPEGAFDQTGALTTSAHWYICGPETLKRTFQSSLLHRGIAPQHVHIEVFASPLSPSERRTASHRALPAGAARLRLAETGALLDAAPQETLLETLERHGYHPGYGCRMGACGDCRLRVLSGQVRDGDDGGDGDGDTLSPAERAAGYVLSCVSYPVGEVVIASSSVPGDVPRVAAARGNAKTALRVGVVAAAVTLFAGVWQLTSHFPSATAAGATTPVVPSQQQPQTTGPLAPPSATSTPNGPSGITTSPSLAPPSTQTGVS